MVDPAKFNRCIEAAAHGESLSQACTDLLREAVVEWPWFMTARLLHAAQTGETDTLVELHYSAYPRPLHPLVKISLEEFGIVETKVSSRRTGGELIEKFLRRGEHRIIPDDATPEDDEAARSSEFDLSDDFISEELAEIYLAQGLNRQAKKIYKRLSLLNPEKSIYFAKIIEGLDDKSPSKKKLINNLTTK